MTPGTAEKRSSDADRAAWAREILSVPEGTDAETVRGVLLRRLAECELVPVESWRDGMAILTDGAWEAGDRWFEAPDSEELEQQVEQFAGGFFMFPPAERRARFEELWAKAERPLVVERLRVLEPGLEVEASVAGLGERSRDLAELSMSLFVARPGDRAMLLRDRYVELSGDKHYESAARELAAQRPEIAGLTDLLAPLVKATTNRRRRFLRWLLKNEVLHVVLWFVGVGIVYLIVSANEKIEPRKRNNATPASSRFELTDEQQLKDIEKMLRDMEKSR